jgi:gliding motility-associated-like protein
MPVLDGNVLYYDFKIFNRWGGLVFKSSDPAKGWNGRTNGGNAEANTYVWTCSYHLEGEERQFKRGVVVLLR